MKLSRDEFEKLVVEQLDLLYRVACRLARRADPASDLVQETCLRALRSYKTFDLQEHGIRPWLVRIMHNLHFSRATREKLEPVSMDSGPLEATQRDGVGDLGIQSVGWDGMDQTLVRAVTELPPDYQTVLLLWAVEDFTYQEIADSLEIPIGTVMSRLYRARHKLEQTLHDFAIQEGVIRE